MPYITESQLSDLHGSILRQQYVLEEFCRTIHPDGLDGAIDTVASEIEASGMAPMMRVFRLARGALEGDKSSGDDAPAATLRPSETNTLRGLFEGTREFKATAPDGTDP